MNSSSEKIEQFKIKYENLGNKLKNITDKTELSQILSPIFKRYEALSEQKFPKNNTDINLQDKIFSLLTELFYIDIHIFKLFFQTETQLSRSQKEKIVMYIFSFGESLTNSTIKVYLINNWNKQFQSMIKQYLELVIELMQLHNEKIIEFTDKGELSYPYPYPYISYKNIKHAILLIIVFMTYIQDQQYLIDTIKFLIDKSLSLQYNETNYTNDKLLKSDFTSFYINYLLIDSKNFTSLSSEYICKYSNFTVQSPLLIMILLKALNQTKKYVDVFLHFIEFTCKLNDNNIKLYIRAGLVKTLLLISEDVMNTTEPINVDKIIQSIQNIFKLMMNFLRKSDLLFILNYIIITLNSVDGYINQLNSAFKINLLKSIGDSIPESAKYCKGITLSNHSVNQPNIYNMIISPGVKLVYNGDSNIISIFQSYKRFSCLKQTKFILLRVEKEANSNCFLEISIDESNIYIKENNVMKGISEQDMKAYLNLKKSTNFQFEFNKNEGTVNVYINSAFFYNCSSNFVVENMTSSNSSFTLITGYMSNSLTQDINKFERYHHITLNYMLVYNDKLSSEWINTLNFTKIKTSKMGTLKTDRLYLRYLTKDYYQRMIMSNNNIKSNNNYFTYYFNDTKFKSNISFELIIENKKIIKKAEISSNIISKISNKYNLTNIPYIEYIPKTNYSNYEISNSNLINSSNNYVLNQQKAQFNHTYLITNYNFIETLKINNTLQFGTTKHTIFSDILYIDSFLDDELNNINVIKYIIVLLNDLDSIDDTNQRKEMLVNLVIILCNYFKVNVYQLELFVNNEEYLNSLMFSLIKNKEYVSSDVIEKLFLLSFCVPKGFDIKEGKICDKDLQSQYKNMKLLCLFPTLITDVFLCFNFFNEINCEAKLQIITLINEYIINHDCISNEIEFKMKILTAYIDLFLQCQTTNEKIDNIFIESIVKLIDQLLKTKQESGTDIGAYKYTVDEISRILKLLYKYDVFIEDHIKNESDPVEQENEEILKIFLGKLKDGKMLKYKDIIKEKLLLLNINEQIVSIITKTTFTKNNNNTPDESNSSDKETELLEKYKCKGGRSKSVSQHSGITWNSKIAMEVKTEHLQTKPKPTPKDLNKEDTWVNVITENKNGKIVMNEEDIHIKIYFCYCCLCKFVRKIIKHKILIEQAFSTFKVIITETYRDIFITKDNIFLSKINIYNNNKIITLSNTSLTFSYYLSLKEGPNRMRKKFIVKPDLILNQEIDYTDKSKKKEIKKYFFDKYSFHNSFKNQFEICKLDQIFTLQTIKYFPFKEDTYTYSCNCLFFKGMTYHNSVLVLGKNKIYIFTKLIQDKDNIIYPISQVTLPTFFWALSDYEHILAEYIHNIKHKIVYRESTPHHDGHIFDRFSQESKLYSFSYLDINEMFKRKFLHQDNALEIFFDNGESLFVAVNINIRDKLVLDIINNYALAYSQRKNILYNTEKLKFQKERINDNKLTNRNNGTNYMEVNLDKKTVQTPSSHTSNISSSILITEPIIDNILYIQNKNNSNILKSSSMVFMKNKHIFLMKSSNSRKIPKMKDHAILEVKQIIEDITEKWSNGIISNFSYLMLLNTLSGRTYNDLSQYPVLPWVISDYASESINLSNTSVYRDLSYPIFAQKPESREKLQLKYESGEDVELKYHSGSHYSSPAFLAYFLIRIKPFSLTAAEIQGGIFDTPDRLFFNIKNYYQIDEKYQELVPEMFTLPELFVNINNYCYGKTTNKEEINDVKLPLWSFGDPQLLSKILMNALESPYVSDNLHDWIDLIFGYKQKGKEAVKYYNVFRPACSSFEPNKIISAILKNQTDDGNSNKNLILTKGIKDELEQKINEIVDMGQHPIMLFNKPHPKREKRQKLFGLVDKSIELMKYIPEDKEYKLKLNVQPKEIFAYYEIINEYISHGQGGLASFRKCYQENKQTTTKGNEKNYATPIYFLVGKKCTLIPPSYKNYIDWNKTKYSFLLVKPLKQICYEYYLNHKSPISYVKISTDGKHIVIGFDDGLLCKYRFKKMKFEYVHLPSQEEQKKKTKAGFIKKIFKIKRKGKNKEQNKDSNNKYDRATINTVESNSKENDDISSGYNNNQILLSQKIDLSPSNTFNKDSFFTKSNYNFEQYSPSIYFLKNQHSIDNFCAHCTSQENLKIFTESKKKNQFESDKNIYLFLINSTKAISSKITLIEICECYSLLIVIDINNNIFLYDFNTFTLQKELNFNLYANDNSFHKIKNVSINHYTGEFIVATKYQIILFNINGVPLAKINVLQFSVENKLHIKKINHCIIRNIDNNIYIFTAHVEGYVVIWSLENSNASNKKLNSYKINYNSKNLNVNDIGFNLKFHYLRQIKCSHRSIQLITLTEDFTQMICITEDKNLIYLNYEEYLENKKQTKQIKTCSNCSNVIGKSNISCSICNKQICSKCKIEEKIPKFSRKNKIQICQECKNLLELTKKNSN